jgi:hypothetical protein
MAEKLIPKRIIDPRQSSDHISDNYNSYIPSVATILNEDSNREFLITWGDHNDVFNTTRVMGLTAARKTEHTSVRLYRFTALFTRKGIPLAELHPINSVESFYTTVRNDLTHGVTIHNNYDLASVFTSKLNETEVIIALLSRRARSDRSRVGNSGGSDVPITSSMNTQVRWLPKHLMCVL